MKEGFKKSWIYHLYYEMQTSNDVVCMVHDSQILESQLKLQVPLNDDILRLLSIGAISIVQEYDNVYSLNGHYSNPPNSGSYENVADFSHVSGVFDYSNIWDHENNGNICSPKTPKSSNPKVVNFKDVPVDIIEGPVVVPDNETPAKPEKQEKKFFDFFRKKKKDKDKDQGGNTPSGGALVNKDPAVQGFFSQYIPRPGVQYYRDLAGNIKQGPIGYTPVCQCMPSLKKLEHQVHTNKEAVGPSQTHTDKYPEIAPKPVLRQRTRSSDGLLLEDGITSAHELAQRSKSEERTLDSTPNAPQILRSQTPQTPRSSSEMRPQGQQNYVNSNAGVPYRYPGHPGVQGQPSAQKPQHLPYNTGVQQPYHQHQNSFSHVKSPQANPSRYPPHEQYNRGQDGGQGLRENPYASVRNVSQYKAPGNVQYGVINKQGLPYRSTYNVNYANQGEKTPFRESSPIVKSFSKSESNLDRSLNDSDHDPGYTSPVNPRGDFLTCRTPTGEISANRDNTKSVANYPNAYNKEDSSSNPDSGYSSKIFGSRTNAGNVQSNSGTPSSSFSTDHDHSMSIPSNNNSPHPQVSHGDYDQIQNVRQRQQVQGQHLPKPRSDLVSEKTSRSRSKTEGGTIQQRSRGFPSPYCC
ncbi:hypothetical protein FSP39_014060 [Pinctada imbricata]|uniref:Uncharacterized protein n=1 Tax=Pinctada imbricata TaxID=66713 RepID=A0AA89C7D2_PINIB|nr:hypothetical protein FSP39_014060 [Pinctada imbricata]